MNAAIRKEDAVGETSPAFVPTAEWLDTYLAQATADLIEAAERYASFQALKVAVVRQIDASYSEELVQDILGDTLMGVIAWDPHRVSLKKHVYDAIKSRTRHDYVHSIKFKAVRLDVNRAVIAEIETAFAEDQRGCEAVSRVTAELLDALTELAGDDKPVQLLLGAYRQHVTKKLDVTNLTGLTSKQYAAARKRMHRLTRQLPASLRDAAFRRE